MRDGATGTRGATLVHPPALVDPLADLGQGVTVGPWAIVGPGVRVGDGTDIGPRVLIERATTLGEDCRISNGAVLGTDPQDMKYLGEDTVLEVGPRAIIREFATLNRGTAASGRTVVGSDCLIMAYGHVAHDCTLGNHVILANSVAMGGHVVIEDWVNVGGLTGIHQFVRIGAHAFIGGASRITQDVPPYCRAVGNPASLLGLNSIGLERRGLSPEVRAALKLAYRTLFQSKLNLSQAMARVESDVPALPEVLHLLAFIRTSERGIVT
ncbi:MAG: acyl-ACP--UDP-N-acetylglucosamine O-acyltransferase [Gemmatimonadetes bacterium]|nr:acyl-ACP--UDP-N-acetylglucosamine O-acyltransferase [Gemmatimonadota bacterium]